MKILAAIFLVIVCSVAASATPHFVQQSVNTDPTGTLTGNFGVITTAGNTIIAVISHGSTTSVDAVTADDGDSNLALVDIRSVAGVTTEIWWINNSDGNSPNWAVSLAGIGVVSANFSEWSNIKTANAEASTGNNGVATSTVTTGGAAATSGSSLVIAIGGWTLNDYSSGPINGFTRMTPTGGTGAFQESAYLINTGTASKSTGWGLTAGINWAAVIAVFGSPGAAPSQNSAGFFMMSQ